MTASFTSRIRQAGLVLAFALTASVISTSQSFAFSAEAQAMCTNDAFKFCSSEIPNIDRITSCMLAKKTQLSGPCRSYIDKQIAARSGKVATND